MVHTPVHASWLNQVEVYLSIIQRRALSPNDFTDFVVEERLTRFQVRYSAAANTLRGKITTNDLVDLLDRLDPHRSPNPQHNPTQRPLDPRWTDKRDH